MNWNLSFELYSVLLLGIIAIFLFGRTRFPSRQNRLYSILLLLSILMTLLNIICHVSFLEPSWLRGVVTPLLCLTLGLTPAVFFYYTLALTGGQTQHLTALRAALRFLPLSALALFLLYCVVSDSFVQLTGSWQKELVFYIVPLYYSAASTVTALKHRHTLPADRQAAIYLYTLLMLILAVFHPPLSSTPLVGAVTTLPLLFLYFSQQDPAFQMDGGLNVFNRNAFLEMTELNLLGNVSFSIVTISLNDFKNINETMGFRNGDRLLGAVAEFLRKISPQESVFRFDGDRFSIIMKNSEKVQPLVDRIQARFNQPWCAGGINCALSVSICIVSCPQTASSVKDVVDFIDFSTARAKHGEKGSLVEADKSMKEKMLRMHKVEQAIETALEDDGFAVYYQPIYNVNQGRFTRAEALLRLYDSELGMIPPDEFIPIAEQNGSILRVGRVVLEKVCRFVQKNNLEDSGFESVEVNLSMVQCMQSTFQETLEEVMAEYQAERSIIHLEITETAASGSLEYLQKIMSGLVGRGFTFSLDDFGTGYANVTYMLKLPFRIVKLDKTLIWEADKSERARVVLDHITRMVTGLNLQIVAEGVETSSQAAMLQSMGCDYIQGYYFSRPVPEEDFIRLLKSIPAQSAISC